jgi:hypothetical protein
VEGKKRSLGGPDAVDAPCEVGSSNCMLTFNIVTLLGGCFLSP